jgi:DNA invertase Pin-like site-specific DNA recombinase
LRRKASRSSFQSSSADSPSARHFLRPKLAEAIKACRLRGAKLIIAKLDRLARNVAFISNLMESGVEFEAVDFPQANWLTIHIMAAMAEHEAKMISDRTKAALAAAKRRGVKLGGDRGARLTAQARAAGRAALQAKAQKRPALSHCGPLQRAWRLAAFQRLATAIVGGAGAFLLVWWLEW